MIPTPDVQRDRSLVKLSLLFMDAFIEIDHDELIRLADAHDQGMRIVIAMAKDGENGEQVFTAVEPRD